MLSRTCSILSLLLCLCLQPARTSFAPHAVTSCPDDWTAFQGSCYYFHHTEQSFTEAQHACLQLESNLIHIDSEEENLFIKNFLRYQTPVKYWWMGLSDDDIEGLWKWVGSGDRPTYTDWYPGEPNNAKNEDCAIFDGVNNRNFMWVDYGCGFLCYSICEIRSETSGSIVVG
ncbi:perlucin-like protein [Dreissena polymorpha]|uniref:C-type lectin domain-containing protein n=1 Tax=Dreissena polymorpha TaxID=45954 RepID=A0A9D4BY20_DREPO|nr:perlucin-like protein [Dreissena polymorpha]KAH3713106.1 hypothetical protein DPMN_072872 [Dreissena polymorpha]